MYKEVKFMLELRGITKIYPAGDGVGEVAKRQRDNAAEHERNGFAFYLFPEHTA